MDKKLLEQVRNLPKIELHLHMEGAVLEKTLTEFAERRGEEETKISYPWKADGFRYRNLSEFVQSMSSMMDICIQKPEDYHRIAREVFSDLANQNVRYAEVSFDLARAVRLDMPFDEIIAAIASARQAVMDSNEIKIGLIIALNRHLDIDWLQKIAETAVLNKQAGIVGVDLHGDESFNTPGYYADAFHIARDGGLELRAHAGEAEGASRVWETLNLLGVSRLGHGIRSLDDPKLIDHLITNSITLEVCPTSNYMLNVVPSLAEHPIRKLFDLGVPVTVNSDDPLFFNTTITDEYCLLVEYHEFTLPELKEITLNAARGAFLDKETRKELIQDIENDFIVNEYD